MESQLFSVTHGAQTVSGAEVLSGWLLHISKTAQLPQLAALNALPSQVFVWTARLGIMTTWLS